jgi:hypothetical protein
MSEPVIRDAFAYGAGDGEPSAALWLQIQAAIAARRQRRLWWRRLAVAAAAVLMLAGGGAAAVPGARAAVIDTFKGWVTVWQGKVGQTDAKLQWTDPVQLQDALEQQGVHPVYVDPVSLGSPAEAEALLGFQPAEARLPGAALQSVQAVRQPDRNGVEIRMVTLQYLVGKDTYRIVTGAEYRLEAGTWVYHPHEQLEGYVVDNQSPTNPRAVALSGGTQAMCFQAADPKPDTICTLLVAGRGVDVSGPNPDTVIALMKSLVK